jgi:hypothetical protein
VDDVGGRAIDARKYFGYSVLALEARAMKIRPANVGDFLKWFVERLCKHPAERLVMTDDTIICQNCGQRFAVSETQFALYATQFVSWDCTENG